MNWFCRMDFLERHIIKIIVLLLSGIDVCLLFLTRGTEYFSYVSGGSVVCVILGFLVGVNYCSGDTENSTSEGSEYDWNIGIARALEIPKFGESSDGEGDVERGHSSGWVEGEGDVERDDSSGWVEGDSSGWERDVERGDSSGWVEGDRSGWVGDAGESSVVLEEDDHLGRLIYQVIREGGDISGFDISGFDISGFYISDFDINETGDSSRFDSDTCNPTVEEAIPPHKIYDVSLLKRYYDLAFPKEKK